VTEDVLSASLEVNNNSVLSLLFQTQKIWGLCSWWWETQYCKSIWKTI